MTTTNGFIGKQQLMETGQRRYAEVIVPGLGKARIQSLTELERSRIEYSLIYSDDEEERAKAACEIKARWIAAALVDGDGNRIFADHETEMINQFDSRVVNVLADAIIAHCGVSKKDREALAKNLSETPTEDSPTDSPAISAA